MFRHLLVHASEHPSLAQGQAPPGLLSPAEETILAGLGFAQRRRKWLLGRWAAKRLLAEMGWGGELTILNDEAGAPYALKAGERLPVCLSISHRGDWGLAAAGVRPDVMLGADLETVEARDAALVRQFFSEAEAARVEVAGAARDTVVARIWSGKEAVLKALGIGLRHDTRDIVVGEEIAVPAGIEGEWKGLEVKLAPVLAVQIAPRRLSLVWRDLGDRVITVAILER
jgi:4'-phosphopantetheinyl transferase